MPSSSFLDLSHIFSLAPHQTRGKKPNDDSGKERQLPCSQWLRTCPPVQGTGSLIPAFWDASTCCRTSKPVRRDYWASTLELTSHSYWACRPRAVFHKRSHCREVHGSQLETGPTDAARKPAHSNEDPVPAKVNKQINKSFLKKGERKEKLIPEAASVQPLSVPSLCSDLCSGFQACSHDLAVEELPWYIN